jgi:hypothetical protein
MKFTVITLTVLAIVVIPYMPSPTMLDDSSAMNSWRTSINENFQGITSDYDFRSFSPQWNDLISDWFEATNKVLIDANNLWNDTIEFFKSPFAGLVEDYTNVNGIDLTKFAWFFTNLVDATAYVDSLTEEQQAWYVNEYDTVMHWTIRWLYWSPIDLGV